MKRSIGGLLLLAIGTGAFAEQPRRSDSNPATLRQRVNAEVARKRQLQEKKNAAFRERQRVERLQRARAIVNRYESALLPNQYAERIRREKVRAARIAKEVEAGERKPPRVTEAEVTNWERMARRYQSMTQKEWLRVAIDADGFRIRTIDRVQKFFYPGSY